MWRPMSTNSDAHLDSSRYWSEAPWDEVGPGAVFIHIPVMATEATPITCEDEWGTSRLYLPTSMSGMAVLYRRFSEGWWFLPILTAHEFAHADSFDVLIDQALREEIRGWFPIPGLDINPSPLSRPAVVCLRRPALLTEAVVREARATQIGQLTADAMDELHESLARSLEA